MGHDAWFVQCGLSVHQQHVTIDQMAIHLAARLGAWGWWREGERERRVRRREWEGGRVERRERIRIRIKVR